VASPRAASAPWAERRVRKRREYLAIQSRAARVTVDALIFLIAPREPGTPTRLGITASRKIGGAVQRNRAKRLLREAFRTLLEELPSAIDLVVIVRKPLGERKLADVLSEWRRAIPQIRRKCAAFRA
jgi:ribonuclease P protein component